MNIISPFLMAQFCVFYAHYLTQYKGIVQNFSLYDAIVWGTWVAKGYTVAPLVDALCYRSEDSGFDS
jgi:hypothetical protein